MIQPHPSPPTPICVKAGGGAGWAPLPSLEEALADTEWPAPVLAAHAAGTAELAAVVAAGGWQDVAPSVKVGKGGRGRIVATVWGEDKQQFVESGAPLRRSRQVGRSVAHHLSPVAPQVPALPLVS